MSKYDESCYSSEFIKKELNKIVCSHISYIYNAERFTTPYVYYKLGNIIFKQVKIFGVINDLKSYQNGDFVLTVDDGSSEIPCIFAKNEITEAREAKKIVEMKLNIQKENFRLNNIPSNVKPAQQDSDTQEVLLTTLILQKVLKILENDCGCNLKLNDYVEIIGNVGPHQTYDKAIYIHHINQVHVDDYFLKKYKFFLQQCEQSFQRLQLLT